jgi:hypothetical protein
MRGTKRRTVASHDVGKLELGACRTRCARMRPHRQLESRGIGSIQQI